MMEGNTAKDHRARIVRGIQAARAKGTRMGRPPVCWDPATVGRVKALRAQGGSLKSIAKTLGMSKRTVGRILGGQVPVAVGGKAQPPTKARVVAEPPVSSRSILAVVKAKLKQIARLQEEVAALEKANAILTRRG